MYMCDVCVHACVCHRAQVEVSRQLCGISSLLPPLHGLQRLNSGYQVCAASTLLTDHLAGPIFKNIFCLLVCKCTDALLCTEKCNFLGSVIKFKILNQGLGKY